MKTIAMLASIIAVFATVAPAQAALSVDGGNRPAVVNQDGSFHIAGRRQPPVCACVRG